MFCGISLLKILKPHILVTYFNIPGSIIATRGTVTMLIKEIRKLISLSVKGTQAERQTVSSERAWDTWY